MKAISLLNPIQRCWAEQERCYTIFKFAYPNGRKFEQKWLFHSHHKIQWKPDLGQTYQKFWHSELYVKN